jgi:hypothetical protein
VSDITDIVSRLRRTDENRGVAICSEAADTIEQLRKERDEARRKICEIESQCICDPPRSPQKYASLFGWDCFKENPND